MARKDASLRRSLDTRIYPLAAIRAAAETFEERALVRVSPGAGSEVAVRLESKAGASALESLSDAFDNELLHETLRLRVSEANRALREYVVTKALVSAQEARNVVPAPAPVEALCSTCSDEPAAPAIDATLEKEIDALLTEIDRSDLGANDVLGIAVSWEEKHGARGADAPAEKKTKGPP